MDLLAGGKREGSLTWLDRRATGIGNNTGNLEGRRYVTRMQVEVAIRSRRKGLDNGDIVARATRFKAVSMRHDLSAARRHVHVIMDRRAIEAISRGSRRL